MKAVVQLVREANVSVNNNVTGEIDKGLVVLLGVTHDDTKEDADYLAHKIINMRIFNDQNDKMNLSLQDIGGSVLSISQFTLYGDTRKGRRPNFLQAAKPDDAKTLYNAFNEIVRQKGITVATGEFGAMMDLTLANQGPVTMILDSDEK